MKLLGRIRNNHPGKIAIECRDSKITYNDLWRRVDELSTSYLAHGLGPGRAIGVEFPRSIDCVVAWLAALNTNTPFVAIDPALPEARKEKYRDYCYRTHIGEIRKNELDLDCAYVFLSSGSTGEAEAILMPASGIDHVIEHQVDVFRIGEDSRVLWMLSPGFDASLSDVFCALWAGATLVILDSFKDPPALVEFLRKKEISHVDIPPSLLSRMGALPGKLETLIVGGEICSSDSIKNYAQKIRIVNCYGPTETTICSSMKVFQSDSDARNIGQPNPGFLYRLEEEELWIHGPGIALQYGGNIHASRFVERDGKRWFRSGDRCQRKGDDFIFLGRIDRQFKVNGQLVNPEEIELELSRNPNVDECRVEEFEGKILAFCTPKKASSVKHEIREKLTSTLPGWMIPRLIFVDEITRNERQKVVTQQVDLQEKSDCLFRDTMSELLGYPVSDSDDFWKVGGDSLLAFDFVQRLAEQGVPISVDGLREFGTPNALRNMPYYQPIKKEQVLGDAYLSVYGAFPRGARERAEAEARERAEAEARERADAEARERGCVLLTGATGFLGRRVLDLLLQSGESIVCIVRAKDDEAAKARLPLHANCQVVAGDLMLEKWGLDSNRFQELADRCPTVIHLAADLNLSKEYAPEKVRKSLAYMSHFFELGMEKKMVFASSLSVFASTDFTGQAKEDNRDFDGVNEIYGGYTAEKMLAEKIVQNSFPEAAILRFGLLTGDSQNGAFHAKNILVSFIRCVVELEMCPRSEDWKFDLTPVDYAAQSVQSLVDAVGIFHLANSSSPSLDDLVEAIERERKIKIRSCSEKEFVEALRELDHEDGRLARVGSARMYSKSTYDILRSGDLFLASDMDFCGKKSENYLKSKDCIRVDDNRVLLERYVFWAIRKKS